VLYCFRKIGREIGQDFWVAREREQMVKMKEEKRKRKRILRKEILRKKTIGSYKGTIRDRRERRIVRRNGLEIR
jgi:hypothetical protein